MIRQNGLYFRKPGERPVGGAHGARLEPRIPERVFFAPTPPAECEAGRLVCAEDSDPLLYTPGMVRCGSWGAGPSEAANLLRPHGGLRGGESSR